MCQDVAKVADLVLLLINGHTGFEMETFEFMNVLQVHGFPKVLGVLTHLDLFRKTKLLRKAKKTLKSRFWVEVYQGAKLFYLSGETGGRVVSPLALGRVVFPFALACSLTISWVLVDCRTRLQASSMARIPTQRSTTCRCTSLESSLDRWRGASSTRTCWWTEWR